MSLLPTATALLLVAAPPAPSDSFRLHEGLPAGFKVDGKLDEWKLPVSFMLGAANQVAGPSRVSSAQDLSARIWVALGPEGLAVAGEVRDDHVNLSTQLGHIHDDHVEVWLALTQPVMPPLAFVNQFGEHAVPTAETCENSEMRGEPADCRQWWKAQVERRKQLVHAFTVQYGLMSGSLVRFNQKDTVGSIRYEPMAGGYRFEALIPPSAFPRSAEAPLRNLRLMVDLVDNDEGKGKLETFLSSSSKRRFGDPSTFHPVTLTQPLRFGAWPELLERALKANTPRCSYQPAPDAHTLDVWVNPAVGYQYSPEEPSPQVVTLDLSPRLQGRLGDVELVTLSGEVDESGGQQFWMVSRRGKTLLDVQKSGTHVLRLTQRPPGLHILQVFEGIQSALGTGACGSCPLLSFRLVKMDAQGRFSDAEELEGAYSQGEPLEWEATPELTRIEAFVHPEGAPRQLVIRYTWNPKTGSYEPKKFERPSRREE